MLFLVFRKIFNNKWLVSSLLLGMVLTVAMVCSIPLFTNGILQRVLVKDLQSYQQTRQRYPGQYEISVNLYQNYSGNEGQQSQTYNYFKNRIDDVFIPELGVTTVVERKSISMEYLHAVSEELYGQEEDESALARMYGLTDMYDHVTLIGGRMPNNPTDDGVLECLIMPTFQKNSNIILDKIYILEDYTHNMENPLKVRPVGIFKVKDTRKKS